MIRAKRITYDCNETTGPQAGDLLRSSRSTYLVVESRRVRSKVSSSRWALKVVNVEASTCAEGTAREFVLVWNKRERRS